MNGSCKAEHIAIGTEILLGQILNRHAQTVSEELASMGFHLYYHSAVGDNPARIEQLYELACSRSNVVIVTGGLGPTEDDLTKECLARFLGRGLTMDDASLEELHAFFRGRNRAMPEANKKQALCLDGGEMIPNPNGTAPGLYIYDERRSVHFFLLPGPPLEMKPMLVNHVLPKLSKVFSGHGSVKSRVLHLCGIGESDVDARVGDVTSLDNPTVAPLAGEGEMLLRITASAKDDASALERIAPIERRLRDEFDPFIYGVDRETLPFVVGRALQEKGLTLSLAESCTGGVLASMITSEPGSSAFFLGGIVSYHNDVKTDLLKVDADVLKREGAVSGPVARQMAEGVRAALGSAYAVSLTGIAGPGGGGPDKPVGLVYGAIATRETTVCYQMNYRGSREQIRLRASKHMLWRLWCQLRADQCE